MKSLADMSTMPTGDPMTPSADPLAAPGAGLPPGTLVGDNYRVVHELGSGGMGTVYFSRDIALERDVALKLVRADLAKGPEARERFRSEARTMARLSHPNVVKVHALGEFEGQPFIAMEYVPGVALATLVRERGGPLGVEEVVVVLDQLCRGVSALHAAGLIHRDIKPANVLVGPAFRVVLADLGLSHARDVATSTWGTPLYLAPELADRLDVGEALAPRIDLYALGVTAYELFTGTLPFENDAERLAAKLSLTAAAPPSVRRPELGTAFDKAILEVLAWSPEERTASADAFRRAITQAALSTKPTSERPPRFLVVDDDESYRDIATHVLTRGFPNAHVERAADGPEGLQAARRNPPDLALVDIDMPRMNGVDFMADLRGDQNTAGIPVIVASAIGGPADWALLQRLGANAFLGKPHDPTQLQLLARMLLERSARARVDGGSTR